MNFLPIRSINEDDTLLVGADLVRLGLLSRMGFPVAEGIVVLPPEFKLRTILEYFDLKDKEVFEQRLTIVRSEIMKIAPPDDFIEELKLRKVDYKKTWQALLDVWLRELRTKTWNEGFSLSLVQRLTSQPVFYARKIIASGEAQFDFIKQDVEIKVHSGKLNPEDLKFIDELVSNANKKLYIPFDYYFIKEGKTAATLRIVKLKQSTPVDFPKDEKEDVILPKTKQAEKCALNILLDPQGSFSYSANLDGMLLSADLVQGADKKILQLIESAMAMREQPVIFKLSDAPEKFGGIRGSLRLIHQESLIKEEMSSYFFARDQKQLHNIELSLPVTRSIEEFKEIKVKLASLGFRRSAHSRLNMELAIPENFVNLQSYLNEGLDGVIINLDEIHAWLGGFNPTDPDSNSYQPSITGSKSIQTLIKFLETPLKVLQQQKVRVIITGSSSLNDDFLEFILEKGVWGIVVKRASAEFIKPHINFLEKRLIRKRTS